MPLRSGISAFSGDTCSHTHMGAVNAGAARAAILTPATHIANAKDQAMVDIRSIATLINSK